MTASKYTLATFTSLLGGGSFGSITGTPSGYTLNVTSTDIELDKGVANLTLTWAPASGASGTWDVGNTSNTTWTNTVSDPRKYFITADTVIFADIGSTPNTGAVSIASGGVQPAAVHL